MLFRSPAVIRPLDQPLQPAAGIAVLHGNLCEQGAVIKPSAATPALLRHRGPAVVFTSMEDYHARIDDPALPIDNNHDEQQIRPWATGRKNWLFAGTLLAGQRAAAIMSLIQSAKLNGHDPHAYLKDVMTRLPTHKDSRIGELLPHRWQSATI